MQNLTVASSLQSVERDELITLTHSWKVLFEQSKLTKNERDQLVVTIDRLKIPATARWTTLKVIGLLAHYYIALQKAELTEMVTADWIDELREYPAWAIEEACRWWTSKENKARHRRLLPGDIGEVCEQRMWRVRHAERMIERFDAAEADDVLRLAWEANEREKDQADG